MTNLRQRKRIDPTTGQVVIDSEEHDAEVCCSCEKCPQEDAIFAAKSISDSRNQSTDLPLIEAEPIPCRKIKQNPLETLLFEPHHALETAFDKISHASNQVHVKTQSQKVEKPRIQTKELLKFMLICTILTTITNFPPGFTNSSVNTAVSELKKFIHESYASRNMKITDYTESLIRSAALNCWYVCQVFGAIMTPFITDGAGRKAAYIYSVFFMLSALVIQYLSFVLLLPELWIFGRSLSALFSPLSDAALILYLQECSPTHLRGMFSFYGEIGYCAMCLLGMILGMRNVLGDSLPNLLSYAILPGFFFMAFLLFVPETPKFLMIVKKDRESALKSLEFFQSQKIENEETLDRFLQEAELEESQEKSSIKEILSTWHLRQSIILASTVLVLNLSFYPILQSSTYFLSSEHLNFSLETSELASTILMVVFLLSCIVGSFFIDRISRRFLVISFGIMSNIFLGLFSLFCIISHFDMRIKYLALGALCCYCVTFGMVLGPISWFIAPELVVQRHRSTVFCLCYGINNVLIAITNFAVVPLFQQIGAYAMIPLFIIPACCCLTYLYFYLPETLGKETHEIVAEIRRREPSFKQRMDGNLLKPLIEKA